MATLKDIAERAGVSEITVSRILNRKNKESWPCIAQRATKIREIARQMGFRPNFAARSMKRGKFWQIACVITRLDPGGVLRQDFDNGYLEVATVELAKKGYSVIFEPFYIHPKTYDLVAPPKLFSELSVDGVLGIMGAGCNLSPVDQKLARLGAPLVWLNRNPAPNIINVVADEVANGELLARQFIAQGHRRIGYLGYQGQHYSVKGRCEGVLKVLREAGLDTSAVTLGEECDGIPTAETVKLLFERTPAITGAICYDRNCFEAVLYQAMSRGIKIPNELQLGYFASPCDISQTYPINFLEIPQVQIATTGINMLLDLIIGEKPLMPVKPLVGKLYPSTMTCDR